MMHHLLSVVFRLADVMFGDESDDEAKGAKKEYKYDPRTKTANGHDIKKAGNNRKDSSPDYGTRKGLKRRTRSEAKAKEQEEQEKEDSNPANNINTPEKAKSKSRKKQGYS